MKKCAAALTLIALFACKQRKSNSALEANGRPDQSASEAVLTKHLGRSHKLYHWHVSGPIEILVIRKRFANFMPHIDFKDPNSSGLGTAKDIAIKSVEELPALNGKAHIKIVTGWSSMNAPYQNSSKVVRLEIDLSEKTPTVWSANIRWETRDQRDSHTTKWNPITALMTEVIDEDF